MSQIHPKYRADIDGLRAVAVLAVVFFHAFPSHLKGGFIGVDIFFVISGYLISLIILSNLNNHSFEFGSFYSRRIRRIFPALLVVLISSHIAGWILLSPNEYQQLGKHIAGGSSFISNLILWNESGYFDNIAETKPLLHLWSLGIEEQFYILWPLILWGAFRLKFNILLIIGLAIMISFFCSIVSSYHAASDAFYLPFNRFWELLLGALLARLTFNGDFVPQRCLENFGNSLSALGIFLIAISLILINKDLIFPGWWALLPCFGAIFLIVSGPNAWLNRYILSHPALVWTGLISFPLYLWHWPIITFYRLISLHEVTTTEYLALIVLSTLLAWCTYVLVEKKFRHSDSKKKLGVLIVSTAVISYAGLNCYLREGLPFRKIAQEKFYYEIEDAYGPTNCFNKIHKNHMVTCTASLDQKSRGKLVFLIGDSHAAHLHAGLINLTSSYNYTLYDGSLSACPPILNFLPRRKNTDSQAINEACKQHNQNVFESIKQYSPKTVILSADWIQCDGFNQFNLLTINQIGDTIKLLKNYGVANVILVGNFPVFYVDQPRLFASIFVPHEKNRTHKRMSPKPLEMNVALKELAKDSHITFISPTDVLCNTEGCLMSTSAERLIPIGVDVSHLSKQGSIFFIDALRGIWEYSF